MNETFGSIKDWFTKLPPQQQYALIGGGVGGLGGAAAGMIGNPNRRGSSGAIGGLLGGLGGAGLGYGVGMLSDKPKPEPEATKTTFEGPRTESKPEGKEQPKTPGVDPYAVVRPGVQAVGATAGYLAGDYGTKYLGTANANLSIMAKGEHAAGLAEAGNYAGRIAGLGQAERDKMTQSTIGEYLKAHPPTAKPPGQLMRKGVGLLTGLAGSQGARSAIDAAPPPNTTQSPSPSQVGGLFRR